MVFVDTSVLLQLYESPQPNLLENLVALTKFPDRIITTYVVQDEFLRSRHRVMGRLTDAFGEGKSPNPPSFVRGWSEWTQYSDARETAGKKLETFTDKWQLAIENPGKNDAVWNAVHRLFEAKGTMKLERESDVSKEMHSRAIARAALGNPPRKDKNSTIGDSLNWEWCLSVCKQRKANLIVLTTDGDFGSEKRGQDFLPNMMLLDEFRRIVGETRILKVTQRTTAALEVIGKQVSDEQKERETQALQRAVAERFDRNLRNYFAHQVDWTAMQKAMENIDWSAMDSALKNWDFDFRKNLENMGAFDALAKKAQPDPKDAPKDKEPASDSK